jgi:hypothetical protein
VGFLNKLDLSSCVVACMTMIGSTFSVHLVFTPLIDAKKNEIHSLAEIMRAIKGASAPLINCALGRTGRVWQTESFDRVLRSSETLDAKIAYILENPVRKGLVGRCSDYPWIWVRRENPTHANAWIIANKIR